MYYNHVGYAPLLDQAMHISISPHLKHSPDFTRANYSHFFNGLLRLFGSMKVIS